MAQRSLPPNGSSRLCDVRPAKLGTKEAEMQIIGCDLHAKRQTVAMLNAETGGSVARRGYENHQRDQYCETKDVHESREK
jgi:hypothetical protein